MAKRQPRAKIMREYSKDKAKPHKRNYHKKIAKDCIEMLSNKLTCYTTNKDCLQLILDTIDFEILYKFKDGAYELIRV